MLLYVAKYDRWMELFPASIRIWSQICLANFRGKNNFYMHIYIKFMQFWGKTCLIFHSPQTNDMIFCWFMVTLYVFPTKKWYILLVSWWFYALFQWSKTEGINDALFIGGSFPGGPGVSLRTSVLGQSTLSLVILGDRPNRSGNSGKFSRVTLW